MTYNQSTLSADKNLRYFLSHDRFFLTDFCLYVNRDGRSRFLCAFRMSVLKISSLIVLSLSLPLSLCIGFILPDKQSTEFPDTVTHLGQLVETKNNNRRITPAVSVHSKLSNQLWICLPSSGILCQIMAALS